MMLVLYIVRFVHSNILKERLERNKYIGTTFIDMYTKCGGILDAYKVCQGSHDPNVVACSSKLNEVAFLCLLNACSNTFNLKEGK